MSYQTALFWFRRDLRLTDNTGLHHASQQSAAVIPTYILSNWKSDHAWTGAIRQHFLCESLAALAKNLDAMQSRLILRCGKAVDELEILVQETRAEAIFFNRDYDPFGKEMEAKVLTMARRNGVEVHSYKDRVLHEADEVLTGSGTEYRIFTPYSKNWLGQAKAEPLPKIKSLGPSPSACLSSLPSPTVAHWDLPAAPTDLLPGGERAARERMKSFLGSPRLTQYAEKRNTPDGETTSRLGQDLRFGLISIRELFHQCRQKKADTDSTGQKSIDTYINELAWREFYLAILNNHPEVFDEEFNPDWRGLPWPGRDDHLEAWKEGRTGFPIVDAGMRQLRATGFMHNRVRMIVSMFLTKDLHCHWKAGESFFMQHLLDGENASNNGGWQWSAGTGADAAPYFRIQNPWTQTKSYDPIGHYIRRWVTELKDVSAERFLTPPKDGRSIAPGYPVPIVDHSVERDRTLAIFKRHRAESAR